MFKDQKGIPNTYIIGVQKAGTTSLHYWLSQHPDIFAPNTLKDVDILANPDRAGTARQYFSKAFEGVGDEKVILHSQVNYIYFKNAIRNLHALSSDAKLIVVLRNPIHRAFSAYNYFRELNQERRTIEDALIYEPSGSDDHSEENANYTYLEHGLYCEQIAYLLEYFDRSQILILEFEDLKGDPEKLLHKVFDFLGITTFSPNLNPKNVTGSVRFQWLQNILSHTSPRQQRIMRNYVNRWFPIEKRSALRRKIREINTSQSKKKNNAVLPAKVDAFLREFYTDDIKKLERLLGRSYIRWLK